MRTSVQRRAKVQSTAPGSVTERRRRPTGDRPVSPGRAAADGHSIANIDVFPSAPGSVRSSPHSGAGIAPVQRGRFTNWVKSKFGGGERTHEPILDEEVDPVLYSGIRGGTREAVATPIPSDVNKGLNVVSGLGSLASVGVRGAQYASSTNKHLSTVVPSIGLGTGTLSATGSLIDAGLKTHQLATGREKAGDKALVGLDLASDLANATVNTAGTVGQYATLAGKKSLLAGSNLVAGPAAIVKGGLDMITGGVGAFMAHRRKEGLENVYARHDIGGRGSRRQGADHGVRGVAEFAKDAQETKRNRNILKVLGGGLAIGGGAALLAASGPVGWGLLGGAALIGGLGTLYRQVRKHKLGKKYRNHFNLQNANVETGGGHLDQALANEPWYRRWNPWNTKSTRTYDLIRGQVGTRVARGIRESEYSSTGAGYREIADLLGVKTRGKKARGKDIATALEG